MINLNLAPVISLFLLLFSSCSMVQKVGINSVADVLKDGSGEILTESNLVLFEQAAPANLKMLEGLWFADKGNTKLLTLLIKGYSGYAYAIHETEFLKDQLSGKKSSFSKTNAIVSYEKSVFYGIKYLELKGIALKDFTSKSFPENSASILEKLGREDRVAMLYFAQALGASANLQRTNVSKLSYLNHVKSILNWTCKEGEDLEYGACGLFSAVIEASTPRIMGGNISKAQKLFKTYINKYPNNFLARINHLQYYLVPMFEEDEFAAELKKLKSELGKWRMKVDNGLKRDSVEDPQFNLFNAMAERRLSFYWKKRKTIF